MATPIEQRGYAHPDVLVSTEWVAQHLNDPERAGHRIQRRHAALPVGPHPRRGAGGLDDRPERPGPPRLHHAQGLRGADVAIGATKDTTVVFYGDKNNWWACYAFWVFQLFGHTNARVMDGGRLKWEKEKRADVSATCRRIRRRSTRRRERDDAPHPRVPRRGARALQEAGAARRRAQPRGIHRHAHAHARLSERRRAARRPHPRREEHPVGASAINPEDGTFKTAEELKKLYRRRQQAVARRRRRSPTAASASAAATRGSR